MKIPTPGWVLAEIRDWQDHARTGELRFRFKNGLPVSMNRDEVVTPPDDHGYGQPPLCPTCGAVLEHPHDFGAKWDCRSCARTWSIHEIRRLEREGREASA